MYLGQALFYLEPKPFIIKCEEVSILGIRLGKEETISDRFDNRLTGNILSTEVFRISAKDNKVVFHV